MTARDDQGQPSQWVIETEPEYDANERDSWYALWEDDQARCVQCGNYKAICRDPEGLFGEGFHGNRDVCWVTAARQNVDRRFRRLHEKAKPDRAGYLPTDGVRIWAGLTEANPGDNFLEPGHSPLPPDQYDDNDDPEREVT